MILFTLLTGLLFAQSTQEEEKAQKLDFEEFELTAKVKKPNGEIIQERKQGTFGSLILLRDNFQPEMIQSLNEIK